MTSFEILTLLVSILAVIISAVSLIRTRSISKKQLELEKITSDLSKKQLQQIHEAELAQKKAFIDVELIKDGSNNQIVVRNTGYSEAKEVCLKIFGEYNPLLEGEYDEKFPVSSLRAGKSVTLFVADEMGAPNNYKVEVSWVDPDGSNQNDVQTIYLK